MPWPGEQGTPDAIQKLEDFARWIVSLDDDDPNSPGRQDRKTVTLTQIINKAREALDG